MDFDNYRIDVHTPINGAWTKLTDERLSDARLESLPESMTLRRSLILAFRKALESGLLKPGDKLTAVLTIVDGQAGVEIDEISSVEKAS